MFKWTGKWMENLGLLTVHLVLQNNPCVYPGSYWVPEGLAWSEAMHNSVPYSQATNTPMWPRHDHTPYLLVLCSGSQGSMQTLSCREVWSERRGGVSGKVQDSVFMPTFQRSLPQHQKPKRNCGRKRTISQDCLGWHPESSEKWRELFSLSTTVGQLLKFILPGHRLAFCTAHHHSVSCSPG